MTRHTTVMLALNLGLAAALAALWLAPGTPARWRHWQAPDPQLPSLADIDAAMLTPNAAAGAAYPAVAQRPLMDPTRRPQAAASAPGAAASAPAPANPLEKVRLQGIVVGPALSGVLIEEDGKSRFVRRGERVGDWTLDSLRDRQASFVRNGESRHIDLPVAHANSADAPITGAPARAAARAPAPRPAAPAVAAPSVAPPAAAPAGADAAPRAAPKGSFGGAAVRRPASAPQPPR